MATDVVLPQWGMNMQEGTLIRWLKEEGDAVAAGEPLAEVETAKLTDEVAAPVAGVLKYIVVPQGETVPVKTLLAVIADPGEEVARPAAAAPSTPVAPAPSAPASAATPRAIDTVAVSCRGGGRRAGGAGGTPPGAAARP